MFIARQTVKIDKPVALEFRIELQFFQKRWFLTRGGNQSIRRKITRSKDVSQQQTSLPTYDAESGNRTRPYWLEVPLRYHWSLHLHFHWFNPKFRLNGKRPWFFFFFFSFFIDNPLLQKNSKQKAKLQRCPK